MGFRELRMSPAASVRMPWIGLRLVDTLSARCGRSIPDDKQTCSKMLPNKKYNSGYVEKRDAFREGWKRDGWREDVSHGLGDYYGHLRLTQEGNHENEKRGHYACAERFGFWPHQEHPEAGVLCGTEYAVKHTFRSGNWDNPRRH